MAGLALGAFFKTVAVTMANRIAGVYLSVKKDEADGRQRAVPPKHPVNTGKPIVSLQSAAPVYAVFSLPQQDLAKLANGMRVRLATDAYPDRKFEGALTAINPDLDTGTRTVSLQATFENADKLLRPGMYTRVEVLLPQEQTVLVIPATSVIENNTLAPKNDAAPHPVDS